MSTSAVIAMILRVHCSQNDVLWMDLQPPETDDRHALCKSAKGPFTGDPACSSSFLIRSNRLSMINVILLHLALSSPVPFDVFEGG